MDKEKYCKCMNTRSYRCSICGLTQDDSYVERLEKENKELKIVLEAWQEVFGSRQLTHALCNFDSVKSELQSLKQSITECKIPKREEITEHICIGKHGCTACHIAGSNKAIENYNLYVAKLKQEHVEEIKELQENFDRIQNESLERFGRIKELEEENNEWNDTHRKNVDIIIDLEQQLQDIKQSFEEASKTHFETAKRLKAIKARASDKKIEKIIKKEQYFDGSVGYIPLAKAISKMIKGE